MVLVIISAAIVSFGFEGSGFGIYDLGFEVQGFGVRHFQYSRRYQGRYIEP